MFKEQNNINIIFYSRTCGMCQRLIKMLEHENLLSYFKLYCVDDKLDQLPIDIEVVPTMIVSTVNKPLVANETFQWIQKVKFIRQNAVVNTQKVIQSNLLKMLTAKKGPIPWVEQEMSGHSDNYAYKEVDEAFAHSYHGYKDEKINSIFTAPKGETIGKQNQEKLIADLQKIREQQDEHYAGVQKEQQLLKVLNTEQQQQIVDKYQKNNPQNIDMFRMQQHTDNMQQQMMKNVNNTYH
jgi:ADP-heptose:LPS heptosyltransferase